MNRMLTVWVLFFAAVAVSAQTLTPAQVQAMEARLAAIEDPAARMFFWAGVERKSGDLEGALRTLTRLVAEHAHEEVWVAKSELICAELYLELGLFEAAEVTARQVEFLNQGKEIAVRAKALREKIKQETEQPQAAE